MTTTVTVDACSWPVQVRFFPMKDHAPVDGAEWSEPQLIEPNTKRVFHVHAGVDLLVHECPLPASPPEHDQASA